MKRNILLIGLVLALFSLAPLSVLSAQERTELVFWGDWTGEGETQINAMVERFNASQDQITVIYSPTQDLITRFLTASTSGDSPDVIIWDRWRTALYAPRNVLLPINDYMEADGLTVDMFFTEAVNELSVGDQIYGLPLTVDARALYYNKALLDAAGIEPPTTWEELRAAAAALTQRAADGTLEVAGFAVSDVGLFNMYLQQAGGSILTEDGTATNFNNEAGLAVLDYWNTLVNVDKVYEPGFEAGLGEGQDAFVTGRVAMQYNGPWMLNFYKSYGDELDFGVVAPPAGPNGDQGGVMGGFGLAISSTTDKADAAWEFVSWWLADPVNAVEWAKVSNNIPGNLEALEDPYFQEDPYLQPFIETLLFAQIRPTVAGYSPMEVDALIPQLQLFMAGDLSAEEALSIAQEQGDLALLENALE
ncbi:MAG: ABC transporter substrate-binding protein [Armatimonadetes bacterium]|nr:ABC transporter substrate-binding protein [Anaerolineae bacterium]